MAKKFVTISVDGTGLWPQTTHASSKVAPVRSSRSGGLQACVCWRGIFLLIWFIVWISTTFNNLYRQSSQQSHIFTVLHEMQTRSYDDNSVRLSVRQMRELWQNERKISPDVYTIRKAIYPSFLRRKMVGGGDPFYPKFCVNQPPLERNHRFWTNNRS